MRTTSYSEFRRHLSATIERVNADHEPVMITRDRGKPAAVLISLEDFAAFEETVYLLRSPRNAERLLEAIEALDGGGHGTRVVGVKFVVHDSAWEDYLYWHSTDRKILQRLNALIRECARTPFTDIGKPEPLRGQLSGWWSRRLTQEHRLVYQIKDEELHIAQCRHHY